MGVDQRGSPSLTDGFENLKKSGPARLRGPGPEVSSLRSESKLQSKLNEPRKIDGIGHNAKVLIVVRATGSIRRSELRMVEEVEEFRPEFNIHSLGDGGPFEHREVEVDHTLLS